MTSKDKQPEPQGARDEDLVVPPEGTDERIEEEMADANAKERRDLEAEQRAIDEARGYKRRVLANGQVDFESLHDHWTSPSEQTMQEHVAGYQSRMSGYLTEPAIVITNQ